MSMNDPLSDMLTIIRNGQLVGKTSVSLPSSKLKKSVVQVLLDEGYISNFTVDASSKPVLKIGLKYFEDKPVIFEISRMSKPSLRSYCSKDSLPSVRGGLGVAIVSTSQGVMTDVSARNLGVGGEVLCSVY